MLKLTARQFVLLITKLTVVIIIMESYFLSEILASNYYFQTI